MGPYITQFFLLGVSAIVVQAVGSFEVNFEPQCTSEDDYGWPRFHTVAELQASPWAAYFTQVYGELPSNYPVCVYDFRAIDREAYIKANITGHTPKGGYPPPSDLEEGDLYAGGLTGYQIYHGSWKPLPDNTWVEISHTAFPSELRGFWVWRERGSGIWYNTGKTKVFPTPADPSKIHAEAIEFLTANCSKKISQIWPQMESEIFGDCAREKGYDSIQFEPQAGQKPVGTFGLAGLTEMVLVNIDGHDSCGIADASKTPLREGWLASRQCECKNVEIADSCGLMPRGPFPFNIVGTTPRLCKLQEGAFWNRWKACDPSACRPTSCGRRAEIQRKHVEWRILQEANVVSKKASANAFHNAHVVV